VHQLRRDQRVFVKVVFRRAGLKDIPTLAKFRVEFANLMYHRAWDREARSLEKNIRRYLKKAMPSKAFIAWLAESGKKTLAVSGMVIWRIPPRWGSPDGLQAYILNMYTIPEARGKGLCTRLLKELIREAQKLSIKKVSLHASKDGEPLYRKAGFREPEYPELELKI
jgi:ribosomal protein S18 acetylase RimI-like enzyme